MNQSCSIFRTTLEIADWVQHFIFISYNPHKKRINNLTVKELECAEIFVLKVIQTEA